MNSDQRVILSFDIGLKRTGVASGHTLTKTANPAGQLLVNNGRFNWPELDQLIAQWQPQCIVIGDPKTDDPHLNKVINRFKSHIQQNHKLTIIEIDERLTSDAANAELSATLNSDLSDRKLTQSRKAQLRDQIAACLILQSYFESLP